MVVMNLLAGKEERCRHRERAVDTGWEGEGGQPESGPDIHSTVCSTESCGGCSAAQGTQLGVRDAQKTWGAGLQREGTYVYKRLIHTAAQQKLTQHWKAITLQSKINFFFFFYFILLYNTVLVLPYIDMNPPWVYMRSQT